MPYRFPTRFGVYALYLLVGCPDFLMNRFSRRSIAGDFSISLIKDVGEIVKSSTCEYTADYNTGSGLQG